MTNALRTVALACGMLAIGCGVAAAETAAPRRLPPVAPPAELATEPRHEVAESLLLDEIVPANYVQPVQGLSFDGLREYDTRRFATSEHVHSSAAQLANNFTADPDFAEGIVVVSEDVAMKIGGYVKADLIHDLDPIDSTDSFITTSIPVGAAPRENARFHARQSRLSFDTRWLVGREVVRVFIESDFFGQGNDGNDDFRLRHAYGTLGRFTAGRTWTTFTDPSAVPQTLDFEGAVSNVNRRQGLVRWEQPLTGDDLTFAIALEDPRIEIEVPMGVMGDERTESPDLVGRLRLERDWGEFQAAGLVRELGFQPTGLEVRQKTAWGFNFTGSVLVTPCTKWYYQITFGEGIGSYRGSPDVVATGPTTAEVLPMFGWMVGVKQQWNKRLTSNFTFSQLSLDDLPGQDPANLHGTTYLAVNLIQNPYERIFWGIEYLHGIRQNVSRAEASADRLQMSFGFYLP